MGKWAWITTLFGDGLETGYGNGNVMIFFNELVNYLFGNALLPFGAVLFTLWGVVYLPQVARRIFTTTVGVNVD